MADLRDAAMQSAGPVFGKLSGRRRLPSAPAPHAPLVVAIHGGTYTSAYFDVPGYSLLDHATANRVPVIAIDRPGYADSPKLQGADATIKGQAAYLTTALKDAWQRYGRGLPGMVIIGHSIGGAIAATIASKPDGLPLLGLAVSGVCLHTPPEHEGLWNALPDLPVVEMPSELKDQLMFGPPGSYDTAMPVASHIANAPCPRQELIDIVGTWHKNVQEILSTITVPVHYRQGEFDNLWIVNQDEIDGFARALKNAPRVDAAMICGTGHCIDFHNVGGAFQLQQLAFALQCGAQAS